MPFVATYMNLESVVLSEVIQTEKEKHWCSFAKLVSNYLQTHRLQHARLLPFTISWSVLKLLPMESAMPFNHLTICHSLSLLPSIFLSISVFSSESALPIRWPKYWGFGFSIFPSNECSGLTSFSIDWFDLLAVSRVINTTMWNCQFFGTWPSLQSPTFTAVLEKS